MTGPWRWKVADPGVSERLGLLYEPGNWGDLLKGTWVLEVVGDLAAGRRGESLRILDPFAGRPHYSFTAAAAGRLEQVRHLDLVQFLGPDLAQGRFPSTGRLACLKAESAGVATEMAVFDIREDFRRAWESLPSTRVLDVSSGTEALAGAAAEEADLVLVDPYDLFDHWKEILARAVPLAAGRLVLLYLYNKAPRSEGSREYYRAFRRRLAAKLEPQGDRVGATLGRVPADSVLPRAFHEVILLGPAPRVEALRTRLEIAAETLAMAILRPGIAEDPSAPPGTPGR